MILALEILGDKFLHIFKEILDQVGHTKKGILQEAYKKNKA